MNNPQTAFEQVRYLASFLGIHVPHPPLVEPRHYGSDEYLFVMELNGAERELRVRAEDLEGSELYDGSLRLHTDQVWLKLNEFYKVAKCR
jgi:hypothetical protein